LCGSQCFESAGAPALKPMQKEYPQQVTQIMRTAGDVADICRVILSMAEAKKGADVIALCKEILQGLRQQCQAREARHERHLKLHAKQGRQKSTHLSRLHHDSKRVEEISCRRLALCTCTEYLQGMSQRVVKCGTCNNERAERWRNRGTFDKIYKECAQLMRIY